MENTYIAKAEDLVAVADAIRTKGETSSQLVFPGGFVTAIEGIKGGVELNFEVVGNPKPSDPKPNTIWVNTSMGIAGWIVSSDEPSDPVTGMVWIVNNPESGDPINVLEDDSIILHPCSVKQYISGSWELIEALIYKDSEWHEFWDGALFDENGNQYEFITGGWVDAPQIAPSYASIMPIRIGVTDQSSGKSVIALNTGSANYYRQSIAWTKNKVDTTGFSAIEVDVSYYGVSGDYGSMYESYIRLAVADGNDWYSSEVLLKKIESKGTFTCPIPTSGEYHIALSIVSTNQNGHMHIQISGVRLVK